MVSRARVLVEKKKDASAQSRKRTPTVGNAPSDCSEIMSAIHSAILADPATQAWFEKPQGEVTTRGPSRVISKENCLGVFLDVTAAQIVSGAGLDALQLTIQPLLLQLLERHEEGLRALDVPGHDGTAVAFAKSTEKFPGDIDGMEGAHTKYRRCIKRKLHIRIFICKRGGEIFAHQDWLDIDCGVSLYAHGITRFLREGACGTLVLRELSDSFLNKPVSVANPTRNSEDSTKDTHRHNLPIDGTALLATSTSLQNACVTHGVDLSAMAGDATRIFCQITWKCPHAKQDKFAAKLHAEKLQAQSKHQAAVEGTQ
jgi:hypothetical protein